MTSVTLTDEQLDRLADALADRIATRLVDRLTPPASSAPRLVDAAELAEVLGVKRNTVYRLADELGAVRLGAGARARMRFDVETARAAIARSSGGRSEASIVNGDGGSEMPPAPSRHGLPMDSRNRALCSLCAPRQGVDAPRVSSGEHGIYMA